MKLIANTWFERDRAYVGLEDEDSGKTIIEFWDEEVEQAIEDGFLNPKDYYNSLIEYALEMKLLTKEDVAESENDDEYDEDDEDDEDEDDDDEDDEDEDEDVDDDD